MVGLAFTGLLLLYVIRALLAVAIIPIAGEYRYDNVDVGVISSAFFIGYFFLQILGGVLTNRYGGHPVLLVGVLLPSLTTLVTPPFAGNKGMLVVMRIITGLFEGMAYPSLQALAGAWAPIEQRSQIVGFLWSGAYAGAVVGE